MKKLAFLILIMGVVIASCKKNERGTPMITSVRSVDTTLRDSSFSKAVPGNLIVIQGTNLDGLKQVFFNDTSAYFNPAYATSTNIIVYIPGTAQTVATDPNVPSLIKLVTDHGTATYSFSLYLPPPSIGSISFDNSGTLVYIKGYNFTGIKKITFPITGGADTALSYTVDKTGNIITAVIPTGTAFNDSLRVYCTFGNSAYSYPPPMIINSVSNENAAAGTTITFTGTNFIGISKVTFPGGLQGTDIQPLGATRFSVTVPAGITAPDSLRITGSLGDAVAPRLFDTYLTHASPGYLSTFDGNGAGDNTGFVGWTGGYADAAANASNYPGGTGAAAFLLQASPMGKNSGVGSQGNPGFIQLNDVPWVANTSAAIKDYSLKFELYVKNPWNAGALWIMMGDWYVWKNNYLARYAPWSTEPSKIFSPSGWITVTIPLTQFVSFTGNAWDLGTFPTVGAPATTFANYNSTALCFALTNDLSDADIPANSINIAIDNVRIVKGN
ncbi:MAG: glycan-binding surface protein [Ferruginibacter sp.]